ncbi:MAG: hypothetical protein M3Q23_16195 [Actinomycetota bacterium]|nr:hypothetical protein [Actinomycetota bacterium]
MDTQETPGALLQRGREAFLRSAWSEAYDALAPAGAEGALGPDDLDALGQAAYSTGRLDEAIRAHEAAFACYLETGERHRAAIVAMWWLSVEYWQKGLTSVADGWDRRAERLLEDEPECVEHGWIAFGLGDTDRGLELGIKPQEPRRAEVRTDRLGYPQGTAQQAHAAPARQGDGHHDLVRAGIDAEERSAAVWKTGLLAHRRSVGPHQIPRRG